MDWGSTLLSGSVIAALVGFAEFLIRRHWDKKDKQSGISAQLATIERKLSDHIDADEQYKAETKRARILQFNKEVREHERHTEEEWIEILKVMDEYESFCDAHPDFPNNRAVTAIANLKLVYQRLNSNNNFAV